MNILVIGDVVSANGCEFLRSVLPSYKKLKGIDCRGRGTSCPDQLAIALEKIKEQTA